MPRKHAGTDGSIDTAARGDQMSQSEAAANARAFVMLILQWAADDDEKAKTLLAKCEADEVE